MPSKTAGKEGTESMEKSQEPAGNQHRGEKPRRQAGADREGSGSLRSRESGA